MKNYLVTNLTRIIIMKKFFLLIAVVCISTGAFAQKGKVTSAMTFIEQGALDKAKEVT